VHTDVVLRGGELPGSKLRAPLVAYRQQRPKQPADKGRSKADNQAAHSGTTLASSPRDRMVHTPVHTPAEKNAD